jgi:hypothetical protein
MLRFLVASAQCEAEKKQVLDVVNRFFLSMEKQDTIALRDIFLKEAYNYYVQESADTFFYRGISSLRYKYTPDRVFKEKLLPGKAEVRIRKRLASV